MVNEHGNINKRMHFTFTNAQLYKTTVLVALDVVASSEFSVFCKTYAKTATRISQNRGTMPMSMQEKLHISPTDIY